MVDDVRSGAGSRRVLPRASVTDTALVLGAVVVPMLTRGAVVRRPRAEGLAERLETDRVAVRVLQRMRQRYGAGPLRLPIPGRHLVVVLAPEHVHRVLAETPEPFSTATPEKYAVLRHFQPRGVLVSPHPMQHDRRRFNKEVLDSPHAVHRSADVMVARIHEEADALLADTVKAGSVTWERYAGTWWRMVRRVVLGDGATDDEALTDDLRKLRATANWAILHPRRRALQARFDRRLAEHLRRAEPGSLAEWVARIPSAETTDAEQQVPQWLFAFDAGAWTSFRTLALLSVQPEHLREVRAEADGVDLRSPQPLPYLRRCLLDTVRLWPTTPAILRETTERTRWEDGPMPERTSVLIYAPFFQRDDENLPEAHRFAPQLWADAHTAGDWPLVPFSAGPAECAGRNLVLHVMSTVVARMVTELDLTLTEPERLRAPDSLPSVLSPFSLAFHARARDARHR